MDSDDVGQPKCNKCDVTPHFLFRLLFLSLCSQPFPPSLSLLSLSLPLSPHQEVDYGSGDEMEEDDGDMFVDEDLDLQAR